LPSGGVGFNPSEGERDMRDAVTAILAQAGGAKKPFGLP
jgi:hypothetical protein